jgi:hypothetical protein
MKHDPARSRSRIARLIVPILTLTITAVAIVALPASASAAPTTTSTAVALAGNGDIGSVTSSFNDGTLVASATLDTSLSWAQPALINVTYDPNLVRQGRSLDPTVSYTRALPGTMTATYAVSASACVNFGGSCIGISFGPINFTASGPCALLAGGSNYTCALTSNSITVFQLCPDIAGTSTCPLAPEVNASLVSTITVTPAALNTMRTAFFAGTAAGTDSLALGEQPLVDPLAITCGAAVGDDLTYQLGNLATIPGVSVSTGVQFDIKVSEPIPAPFTFPYVSVDTVTVPIDTVSNALNVTAPGFTLDLGAVAHNNIPPTLTVSPPTPQPGAEGSPIFFGASATGPCAAGSTFVWTFSDGGHEFGPSPQHTFPDDGVWSGNVTVTDTTGLTASSDFSVTVNNVAPAVVVLPATATIQWGRDLTVQAQAVAASLVDQSTLTYQWNFADNTPVVTGGASQTHQWAQPGSYTPSVMVCDDGGGCTTQTFSLTVIKRATSIGYTGDTSGTFSAATNLSASLVDQYGHAVNGRTVAFTLGGAPAGSALTNSVGTASRTATVGLLAGSYPITASFGGDSLYLASGPASTAYSVAPMASKLAYTGSTFGGPNKSVALSATVTDALGGALSGVVVTFKLGSQTVMATTNGTGVAATTLVLTQKPGIYAITASWPGVTNEYLPASASSSFSLNKK